MAETFIRIDVPDGVAASTVATLLRDALHDFQRARAPLYSVQDAAGLRAEVTNYVERRYGGTHFDDAWRAEKVEEVLGRLALADRLVVDTETPRPKDTEVTYTGTWLSAAAWTRKEKSGVKLVFKRDEGGEVDVYLTFDESKPELFIAKVAAFCSAGSPNLQAPPDGWAPHILSVLQAGDLLRQHLVGKKTKLVERVIHSKASNAWLDFKTHDAYPLRPQARVWLPYNGPALQETCNCGAYVGQPCVDTGHGWYIDPEGKLFDVHAVRIGRIGRSR